MNSFLRSFAIAPATLPRRAGRGAEQWSFMTVAWRWVSRVSVVAALVGGLATVSGEALAESAAPELSGATGRRAAAMVVIPAGSYAPILRGKDEPERTAVPAFRLDARPVTNAEFLAFVQDRPKWRRSRIASLFAEQGYLGDWAGDLELGPLAPPAAPVVRVSWFAARAFAAWSGQRLPTTAEWERAASIGFTVEDSAQESDFIPAALAWFGQPTPTPLPSVGLGRANFHGVRDLLSLVWEWVDDFNTAMVTGESRADTGLERTLFCGAGSAGARDLENYPAFMRAGMRSSLRASYVVPNLGFRCAQSIVVSPERVASIKP